MDENSPAEGGKIVSVVNIPGGNHRNVILYRIPGSRLKCENPGSRFLSERNSHKGSLSGEKAF